MTASAAHHQQEQQEQQKQQQQQGGGGLRKQLWLWGNTNVDQMSVATIINKSGSVWMLELRKCVGTVSVS